MFDYSKLRGLIREKGKTYEDIASSAEMSLSQFSRKMNGHRYFGQLEILRISEALAISSEQIGLYFFTT